MKSTVEKSWNETTEEEKIVDLFNKISSEIDDKKLRKTFISRPDLHQQIALFYLEVSSSNLSRQEVYESVFSRVREWLDKEEQIRNRVHTIGVFRQHYIENIFKQK